MTLVNRLASRVLSGAPVELAFGILTCLAARALGGLVNGCLVVYGRMQPIIATLATGAVYIGIALFLRPTPGGTLYVADSGASDDPAAPRHIRAFDVADGRLTNGRVFARIEQGVPDGIRVDGDGNLWSSAADGVHCFAPDGTSPGMVRVPETVSNLTFGGPRRNVLYITATTGVYAITTDIRGAQTP